MIAALFLLLADVVCINNGDGTWTCSGEGYGNVSTNGDGQAVCTNCVNISPAECERLKNEVIGYAQGISTLDSYIQSICYQQIPVLDSYIAAFSGFTDFPWTSLDFNDLLLDPSSAVYPAIVDAVCSGGSIQDAYDTMRQAWLASTNYTFVGSPLPSVSITALGLQRAAYELFGLWHGSYQVAQAALPALRGAKESLNGINSLATDIESSANGLEIMTRGISCATCQMSSGEGGSGVDQGCRDCYLVFLRRYEEQLNLMLDQLGAVTNIQLMTLNAVNSGLSTLSAMSNNLQRIDDYLIFDQSNILANVQQAIIVISNNVDSIQRYYYHTFSNASDITSMVYYDDGSGSEDFQQVIDSVFKSTNPADRNGFNLRKYERFDWFKRIEMLLADIAGLSSESNPATASDSALNDVRTSVESLQSLSDLPTDSSASLVSNGQALRGLSQSIAGLFPSQPQRMVLLEARYWIGDTDLTLGIDSTIVQFCRTVTVLIWTVFAAVVFWLLISRAWVVIVDLAKFFVNWLPKIFGN